MTPATPKTALLGLALALAGAASCSFVVDYDLEGKPCGNNKSCREGYVCVKNACMLGDGDASTPAARDAGPRAVDAGEPAGDAGEPLDADLEPPDADPESPDV